MVPLQDLNSRAVAFRRRSSLVPRLKGKQWHHLHASVQPLIQVSSFLVLAALLRRGAASPPRAAAFELGYVETGAADTLGAALYVGSVHDASGLGRCMSLIAS